MTKEELEKEAEIYALSNFGFRGKNSQRVVTAKIDYQYGAEFGYNKANKWHDLRKDPNDLPKENMKQVMVITNYNECLMGWYCIHEETWYSSSCPDSDDYIETGDIMDVKVIKWKEIVLPKESK